MPTKTHRLLRLILLLSNSYPKTKESCNSFLGVKDSAFYNYVNVLKDTGFNIKQKDGKYWIDYPDQDYQVLRNVLHFSDEETYILTQTLDKLEINIATANRLKQKLVSFFNQDKAIEAYLQKEKSSIVQALCKAQQQKKQILLINYASGNSKTVKNRMVEPFEFKDDFNLVWAFDTYLKQNRQFKICRIENINESPFKWEYEREHHSTPIDIFRNTGELNKQLELKLNLKSKNLLIEEYPISERFLTKVNNNLFMLKTSIAKYEGPARFILGLADDIKVLGDDGLLDFIQQKINKLQHFSMTSRFMESNF